MGGALQDVVSYDADTTPVVIASEDAWTGRNEYMLVLTNEDAVIGGVTAYINAATTDAAINGLAIPPMKSILSGPYSEMPYLYAASTRAILVSVIAFNAPSQLTFQHTDITTPGTAQAGSNQPFIATVTAAANAGATVLATATAGAVRITGVNIVADGVTTADLTSAAVTAGAAGVNVLIDATDAVTANINAADEQVAFGDPPGIVLDSGDTVSMNLIGGGATAVALSVYFEYSPIIDGAYLA